MKVFILGSGGREHAFAWKIAQSPLCSALFVAPGNAGTATVANNVAIEATDFEKLADFIVKNEIELVVVGPEAPLVAGFVDFIREQPALDKVRVVGPSKAGAMLEGSKDFAKRFMMRYGIPTAAYRSFDSRNLEEGIAYLATQQAPYVLKADGLASGKGVLIIDELLEAQAALRQMITGAKFGAASQTVVVEQFLQGIELSVFVLTDGKNYRLLPAAKDYKRVGEGDTGLNTGGMGAVSPVPFANEVFLQKVEERIVQPTLTGLQQEGIDYVGFIFIGLMNVEGNPYVIEYNVRMGDPETEVVIPRIKSDFLELLDAASRRQLATAQFEIDSRTATTVMLVSGGYPEAFQTGKVISGLDQLEQVIAFHAGTKQQGAQLVTAGGRVIALTALADTMPQALQLSYRAAETIAYEGKYYRRDIGQDLLHLVTG
ncbi:MAG: phosphoribosylamine--glycine ligase [Cytophagales bacterium]|nr:phosphoribosylamine--glycine ligase [Bernardetiaceae bacterium]MDW8205771.1 phosphoribosylamine--glycine ligase [Cytophagales bacterium]